MDRLLCSVVLIVFIVHCSSLAIQRKELHDESTAKQAADNAIDVKLDTKAATMDDLEELRKNYGMLLDQMIKRRSHPFGWGLKRYNSDTPPFEYGRFGVGAGDAIQRARDHPFGFSISKNNRFSVGDHPFGFGLSRKDSIPSNTQAFHGRRRDMMMMNDDASSVADLEGAKRISQWLDEKIMRE